MGRCSIGKLEALLRLFALCTLGLSAVLMATDSQTRLLLGVIAKKASFNLSKILVLSVYLHAVGAGYNLAQVVRCLSSIKVSNTAHKLTWSSQFLKWTCFLVDQILVYIIFAINCAASQFSITGITGEEELQWLKLCDRYRRFCFQVGGSLACGILASILLAIISGISTFNLFRWYSPDFLCLKPKRICVEANAIS